jgi:DNA replication protein DnaC
MRAEATLADAILDRLLHNAYKIALKGESMRKLHGSLTSEPSVQP